MWKIRTEVDLATGSTTRWFRYQEVSEDGICIGDEIVVPEAAALQLMKDMIRGFPQVVEILIKTVNDEDSPAAPPDNEELELPTRAYIPPAASAADEEPIRTPIRLSRVDAEAEEGSFTLADLAPRVRGERDAPQG